LNRNREIEEEVPMVWRSLFRLGVLGTRAARQWPDARRRDAVAVRRRRRPGLESLEGRQLLAAITDFPLGSNENTTATAALTVGPDGNLWFPVENGSPLNGIGRITPAGAVTVFPPPGGDPSPSALTAAPDGNLWFTTGTDVARITPAGVITEFAAAPNYSGASALTVGPDNDLWFTEGGLPSSGSGNGAVVQMTLNGVVAAVYPVDQVSGAGSGVTVGLDRNLWFSTYNAIGSIAPTGTVRDFPLPASYGAPGPLTTGSDGNLWFSNVLLGHGSAAIGRITPSGVVTEFPVPSVDPNAFALTAAPDSNLWFLTNTQTNGFEQEVIGRITPAGVITLFPFFGSSQNTANGLAPELTIGPDNNLYFTIPTYSYARAFRFFDGTEIGRVTPAGVVSVIQAGPNSGSSGTGGGQFAPTVGPDGKLWFPDGANIGWLDPGQVTPDQLVPPAVSIDTVNHSGKTITSVVVSFDTAMVPSSAGTAAFYKLASGSQTRRGRFIIQKALKIKSPSFDSTSNTVTLTLARPVKGQVKVTVRGGVMALNGTSTSSSAFVVDYTGFLYVD
jgi:streptogramin lyase